MGWRAGPGRSGGVVRDAEGVQITMFGPLAVDGRPVRGARLATVIRTLVDARGRVVSSGALVEAVWDGRRPTTRPARCRRWCPG